MLRSILYILCLTNYVMLISCSQGKKEVNKIPINTKSVTIDNTNGNFHFQVDGQPFTVKGVGMGGAGKNARFRLLKDIGGNSIRTWDTKNVEEILDSASNYGFMVAIGLTMGKELHGYDYNDSLAVQKQHEKMKADVDKYKDHPNLLCWVAGNELNLFFAEDGGLTPVNPKTYMALDDIVDYIHEVDPHHPVTTTFAGVNKTSIDYALKYAPNLDFLSYQVYGDLPTVPSAVAESGSTLPYLITEYGPIGHWERPSTSWGREIEENTTQKANGLALRMQAAFVNGKDGKNMGGYAFLWGQKQERTPTWYGMFNKSGEATAVIDELSKLWTGKYPLNRAPQIEDFVLNETQPTENIFLKPKTKYSAKVSASDFENDNLTYKWVIMQEVIERSEGGGHEVEPPMVDFEIVSQTEDGYIEFISPNKEIDYRLYVYVYDGNGKVGNANIPFYVK